MSMHSSGLSDLYIQMPNWTPPLIHPVGSSNIASPNLNSSYYPRTSSSAWNGLPFQKPQSCPTTSSSYPTTSFGEVAPTHKILCPLSIDPSFYHNSSTPSFLASLPPFSSLEFLVHLENDSLISSHILSLSSSFLPRKTSILMTPTNLACPCWGPSS